MVTAIAASGGVDAVLAAVTDDAQRADREDQEQHGDESNGDGEQV
jgi:hypothetical protein